VKLCEECATPLSSRIHYGDETTDLIIAKLWFCDKCHPELATCLIEI